MPDHPPYLISLEYVQTVNTPPKFIQIKQHSLGAINIFKLELLINICDKLNNDIYADPDENYNLFEETITKAINKFLLIRKFNKHKHKKLPWITLGIIRSIKFSDKLYSKLKQTPVNTEQYVTLQTNLHTYNGLLEELFK